MKRVRVSSSIVVLLLATTMFLPAAGGRTFQQSYGKLPLAFEENRGQAPAGVAYLSHTRSGLVTLHPDGIQLEPKTGKVIAMRFAGAAKASRPAGEQKLPGITSYLVGSESEWIRGVPNFASVRYPSVYPGIDAVFHGNDKDLEYDFVLRPGADPDQIRIVFDGVDRITIDPQGHLELATAHGMMKQRKPIIWQTGPGGRREVAGRYILSGAAEARFELDAFDRRETLVIDPIIEYSSYFGSERDDRVQAIATDSTGAVYIAGSTATATMSWGFVSKLNPAETAVVYTVFFGSGQCDAAGRGIAVDSGNNAVVTGYYVQLDAANQCTVKQVYGARINAAGDAFVYELVWGGGRDYGNAVAVDGAGNAYFTGSTRGSFPTTPGVIQTVGGFVGDGFITKLSPTGAPLYSTYLGDGSADEGLAIAVDANGNAHVAGFTASSHLRTTANAVQTTTGNTTGTGFVTKVNSSAAQVLYSTFLGGNSNDGIHGIAVDGQGRIHVTGATTSSNFLTTSNAWDRICGAGVCNAEDAFYAKIDPLIAGAAGLVYSTFLGGANRDFGQAIAIDQNGRVWITGRTASGDFPTIQPTQGTIGGDYDAFAAQFDAAQSGPASLRFASFLGGAVFDGGTGIEVDALGNIHIAGYTGSTNFPLTNAAQPGTAGGNDGFLVRIEPSASALASITLSPASVTAGANSTATVTLSAAAPAGGAVVNLTSSNTNAATVPASVTVAAGATTANFFVASKTVSTGTAVTVSATYNGVSKTAALTVNPALSTITLNPSVLTGGAGSTGTVTLLVAAPAAGAVVTLTSSNTNAANVPASVTVAAGAKTATFAVTTSAVATTTSVNITATYLGASKIVTLVVNPPLTSITVNPVSVVGGATSTATVTIANAAPPAGAVVTLTSNNINAATVPASVTVAAGGTTATFAVTSKPVATATAVVITATYSGASKTVTLAVDPALSSLLLNPTAVAGGATSTATVTLASAVPAGGAVVTLTSNNINAATVPASVSVAAGATTATFAVTSKAVTTVTAVTITGTYNGSARTATLTVNPAAGIASLALNPTAVVGGATSTGTVTLAMAAPAGGGVVTLTSNNINAATVPASVTVAAGATTATFAVTSKPVTTVTAVTITGTYSGVAKTATLTVNPPAGIAALALNPTAVVGGATSTGTVTLATAAPGGGAVVGLTSNNINAATVPASVSVAAGATTATFAVSSKPVTTFTAVTITGTYNGVAKTTTLTVNPPAATLAGLALNPTAVVGGATSTGTVTLAAAAPVGGAVVALTSNNINGATVPASVTVAAGATTATFAVTSKTVTAATAVTITGTYNGVAKTATLTVNRPAAAITAVALNPTSVVGGATSTGTATLANAAPVGGAVVALASNNINAATVPASVTVAAGATAATFVVTSKPVTTATAVVITGTYNAVVKTATLTVNPPAALAALRFNPATIIFGASSTGTVTLTSPAPAGGAVVALSSSEWLTFNLPASVTVPAGARSVNFTVTSALQRSTTTITASYNGVNKAAVLTSVNPAVVALTCAPNPVIAGTTTICTVTMNGVMPSAETVFVLSDQPFFAPGSGTVTVPAGARTTAFSINTTLVPEPIVAHISANALATATVTTPLTINLTNRGRKWVLNNVTFKNGGTASGYFTYDAATGEFLDVNIRTTAGADPNNPLGHPGQDLYYYPWPNGFNPTFINTGTPTLLKLQDSISVTPPAWTTLQLNFAQPLSNAGGTVGLVSNPNVAYTTYCVDIIAIGCTPPPGNISQELLALPPYLGINSGYYFRVIVSGTVTAQ